MEDVKRTRMVRCSGLAGFVVTCCVVGRHEAKDGGGGGISASGCVLLRLGRAFVPGLVKGLMHGPGWVP